MADPITIFRKTTGLNTLIDPVDLDFSEGVQELAVAADVEISDKGRLSRRKGYTSLLSGSYHSLFCANGPCICVSGTTLYLVASDYSLTSVATVTENATISACQVNDQLFWMNGYEKGYIKDDSNHDWEMLSYVGPTTYKTLTDPPIGTIVRYYNGRIYIVQDGALWISEPYNYNAFDLTRGIIPFSDQIIMVQPVSDGIFLSTNKSIFFLSGSGPLDFEITQLTNYPAIAGTDTNFFGNFLTFQDGTTLITKSGDKATMFLTTKGICGGFTNGKFVNLTEDKIDILPKGLSGSGIVYAGKYIGLINS